MTADGESGEDGNAADGDAAFAVPSSSPTPPRIWKPGPGVARIRVGEHVRVDGRSDCPQVLDDVERIRDILLLACVATGATVLETLAHKFEPQGCSVVALLSESHGFIHTFPERGSYTADLYTCGDSCDVAKGVLVLESKLGPDILTSYAFRYG